MATAAATLATVTILAPTGTAAHAASGDWRTAACAERNRDGLALGTYTVAQVQTQRVEQVPSLTISAESLVFASGARCDLLSLDGRAPFGRDLTGYGSTMSRLGELVVGGASQGETEGTGSVTGVGGSVPIRRARHEILGAVVFNEVETGTMPDHAGVPAPWRNQPYTTTHTRTTFTATINGALARKKTFTVTRSTKAAAKRRLDIDLALADSAAERRDARATYRLALRGIRLVMKTFRYDWSSELPR